MNLNISFLFCQDSDDSEPYILFKEKENGEYELPNFEVPNNENNIDNFISETFKKLTKVYPLFKNNNGWIPLFLTTTLVYDNKSSFLYMCKLTNLINIEEFKKVKMSQILDCKKIKKEYLDQIIEGFNSVYR